MVPFLSNLTNLQVSLNKNSYVFELSQEINVSDLYDIKIKTDFTREVYKNL